MRAQARSDSLHLQTPHTHHKLLVHVATENRMYLWDGNGGGQWYGQNVTTTKLSAVQEGKRKEMRLRHLLLAKTTINSS